MRVAWDLDEIMRERRPATRTLGLVAHDERKDDLLLLAREHPWLLRELRLVATGTTGRMLSAALDLPVGLMASGPEGGDLQIGVLVVQGNLDAIVLLRDPLTAHPHEPDIHALLKACDVHGLPLATNVASARILLEHLGRALSPAAQPMESAP
jgi:methylglyoxal synthase